MPQNKTPIERLSHASQLLELLEHYVSLQQKVEAQQGSEGFPWAGFCSTLGLSKELLLDTIEELKIGSKAGRQEERREVAPPQVEPTIPSRSRNRSVTFNQSQTAPTNPHHSAVGGGMIRELSDERSAETVGSTFNRIQLHDAPTPTSAERQ